MTWIIESCAKCRSNQKSKENEKPIVDNLVIGSGKVVFCQKCGHEGPIANHVGEAIDNWNHKNFLLQ